MKFFRTERHRFSLGVNPSDLSTAQQKGVRTFTAKNGKTFVTFYKKKKVVRTENLLCALLKPHRPSVPIKNDGDTCVLLEIAYMFPHTAGSPKWKREGIAFMTQRPDVDNLSKSLVDCMTECGFWEDDSMVNEKFVKFRSPDPRIDISIEVWRQERETVTEQLPNC